MPAEAPSPDDIQESIKEREERIAKIQGKLKQSEVWERAERKERVSSGFKLVALALAVLVVMAGGVWAVSKLTSVFHAECQFHEHASFRVAVEGDVLSFQHKKFDMQGGPMPMRAHLHQPNDYQIHLEGSCADVGDFFSFMGMKLKPGYLKLDDVMHDGRELREDGNNTLRFYLYHDVGGNGTWEPYEGLIGHQPRDQQRMLVAYGNYTQEEVASLQARVPEVKNA